MGSIPGPGRSSGEGHGNPLQYSCLENPMDRGAWWATVRGDTKSPTQLKRRGKAEGMKQHQLTFLRVLVETATEEGRRQKRSESWQTNTLSAKHLSPCKRTEKWGPFPDPSARKKRAENATGEWQRYLAHELLLKVGQSFEGATEIRPLR